LENISDPLCAPSWHQPFLDDVASTDTVIVLETAAGARVVLVSEHEYLRLARGKVVQPDAVDKLSGREKKILKPGLARAFRCSDRAGTVVGPEHGRATLGLGTPKVRRDYHRRGRACSPPDHARLNPLG
jgi:hypothetical protein